MYWISKIVNWIQVKCEELCSYTQSVNYMWRVLVTESGNHKCQTRGLHKSYYAKYAILFLDHLPNLPQGMYTVFTVFVSRTKGKRKALMRVSWWDNQVNSRSRSRYLKLGLIAQLFYYLFPGINRENCAIPICR